MTSKVLPRFLGLLPTAPPPMLLDLGPVVGQNISFFGEHLACKIFVEDLFAEVDAAAKDGTSAALPAALEGRLRHAPGSLDGILCWDLFDFLDRPSGQALAPKLVSLLRKGGLLYGFFGASPAASGGDIRFIVESPTSLRLKPNESGRSKRTARVTRDVNRMFDGLTVVEAVLLKSGARETLFRKT